MSNAARAMDPTFHHVVDGRDRSLAPFTDSDGRLRDVANLRVGATEEQISPGTHSSSLAGFCNSVAQL
jgi:hypothetical protein